MKLLPNHITVWYKFSYKLTWISDMIVNDYTTENIEVLMYIHKLYFILYLIDLFTPNFQYKKWTSARVRDYIGCTTRLYWLHHSQSLPI